MALWRTDSLRRDSIEGRHGRRPWDLSDWFALRRVCMPHVTATSMSSRSSMRRLHFATLGIQLPPIVLTLTGREELGSFDRWLARRMTRVQVPHEFAAKAVMRKGVPANVVSVVPLAIGEPPPLDRATFCQTNAFRSMSDYCHRRRMETRGDFRPSGRSSFSLREGNRSPAGCWRWARPRGHRRSAWAWLRRLTRSLSGMRPDFPSILGMATS